MKIKMLRQTMGCDDGFTVMTYEAGEVYEVSDDLARCFLADGSAEEVKNLSDAPENKSRRRRK